MTKLTWTNVVGQSTNAGTTALSNAGGLFNSALESFKGIADDKQAALKQQNTAQALDNIRQLKTTEEMSASGDSLTTEAFTKKYGLGNFDPSLVTAAATAKEASLREIDREGRAVKRSDALFEIQKNTNLREAQREDRAIKEQGIQDTRRRKAEAKADEKEEVLGTISTIPSIEQEVSRNRVAMSSAITMFTQAGGIKVGDVRLDNAGNPVFSSSLAEEKKETLLNLAKDAGYSSYTSLADKIMQFRTASPDAPESILRAGEQIIQDRYNRTPASTKAKEALRSSTKKLEAAEERELEVQARKFDRALKQISPDAVETKESRRKNLNKLSKYYDSTFEDAVFLSSWSDDLGGTEGWEAIQVLLKDGVVLPSGASARPPPDVIQEALLTSTYNRVSGFTDTHFDLDELTEEIIRLMSEDAFKVRNENFINNVELDNTEAVDRILKKYSDKSNKIRNKIYRAEGIVDRSTPARFLNNLRK